MENAITLKEAARDYEIVRRNLDYLRANWRDQPSLDLLAERNGLSAAHLQRLFMRWAGLSPKAFVQALTIDHARKLLRDSASVLDTSLEVGLSGPGRLHDLFVTHEGMTPGAYKARGKGLTIRYGFHDCPFGKVLLMMTGQGICGVAFADEARKRRVSGICGAVGRKRISWKIPMPPRARSPGSSILAAGRRNNPCGSCSLARSSKPGCGKPC